MRSPIPSHLVTCFFPSFTTHTRHSVNTSHPGTNHRCDEGFHCKAKGKLRWSAGWTYSAHRDYGLARDPFTAEKRRRLICQSKASSPFHRRGQIIPELVDMQSSATMAVALRNDGPAKFWSGVNTPSSPMLRKWQSLCSVCLGQHTLANRAFLT
ncbi:Hypothetical protein FKW44_011308 [Caligus rogercresseyi]|uniref:Uncharacterized protein n=1 Tax=Caligus rogercresseyi TaxID=217165 RepID=A0A7T8HI59_CALRO|nr:Hypothetical protein FKW44_011308 [Caligus rogercresseyi]